MVPFMSPEDDVSTAIDLKFSVSLLCNLQWFSTVAPVQQTQSRFNVFFFFFFPENIFKMKNVMLKLMLISKINIAVLKYADKLSIVISFKEIKSNQIKCIPILIWLADATWLASGSKPILS